LRKSYDYKDLHRVEKDGDFVLVYLTQLVAFYIDAVVFVKADENKEISKILSSIEGLDYSEI